MFHWIDAIAAPLLVIDISPGRIVAVNEGAKALLGAGDGDASLAGRAFEELMLIEDFDAYARALDDLPQHGVARFTVWLREGAGPGRRFGAELRPLTDAHRLVRLDPVGKEALRRDFFDILDQFPAPVEIYDRDLNALFYNRAADELFLYDGLDISQHDDWWAVAFPDPTECAAAYSEWKMKTERARREPGYTASSEWKVLCRDGQTRMVQFRYRWIGDYFVFSWWDMTADRRNEEELRQLAVSDPLTGLWNRRRLVADAEAALANARGNGAPCALLLLDIDWFKSINDRFGHGAGDEVLRTLARRGRAALRTTDLMARMGGEEFAVLLPETTPSEAERIARHLLDVVREPVVTTAGLTLHVTASIGIASSVGECDVLELIERADRALYRAKQKGRDRVETGAN